MAPRVLISDAPCRPPPSRSSRIAASRSTSSPTSARTRTSLPRSSATTTASRPVPATKVTLVTLEKADATAGDRPRRHRCRQCRYPGRDQAQGHHRDEHAVRQLDHHRRARHHADARALARQIPPPMQSTQAGSGEKNRFMGVEITGKTLGVVGCGNIGSIVANRGIGLKMKVIAFDPFLSEERAKQLGVERVELDDLLQAAPISSRLHTPLTDKTKNVIDAGALAKTRKGVRIINRCARRPGRRGGVGAPCSTVRQGRGRGLRRVRRVEPATANPLFGHPNVVCTPHLGAATTEAQENVALQVAEQMSDYLLRGAISNAVNFPSITAEEAPRLKPFIALAEKLGSFAGQLTESQGLAKVQITYEGAVAADAEHQGAHVGGDRRPAAPDAAGHQRGVGADRRQGARHRGRGDHARGRRRLREPDHRHGRDRVADALGVGHGLRRRAPPASLSIDQGQSAWTRSSRPR